MALAWFLGVGGVIAAALSGGDPAALAGGLAALLLLPLTAAVGGILALVGGVWIVVRVLADRRDDKYSREVER